MKFIKIINNRLNVLLIIRYKNIKITLLSNFKENKFSRKLIKITFNKTKNYLSEKKTLIFMFTLS